MLRQRAGNYLVHNRRIIWLEWTTFIHHAFRFTIRMTLRSSCLSSSSPERREVITPNLSLAKLSIFGCRQRSRVSINPNADRLIALVPCKQA